MCSRYSRIIRFAHFIACLVVVFHPVAGQTQHDKTYFQWQVQTSLPPVGNQQKANGVAGPIAGIFNDVLIIAGGANFDLPYWGVEKEWHDDIFVLTSGKDKVPEWIKAGKLDHSLAYSAVVSSPIGVIAMGGCNDKKTYDEVLLLKWEPETQKIIKESLPPLPKACSYGSATLLGNNIYLAGGSEGLNLSTAMTNFWRLDLSKYKTDDFNWEVLPSWPGPKRGFNITVAQHNGNTDCIYVISGRKESGKEGIWDVLDDVYEFNPEHHKTGQKSPWRKRSNMPFPRMAGTGIGMGQSHVFILSGADGSLYQRADSLKANHPGFSKTILGYHTITDTWFNAGSMPENQVTTQAFQWNDNIIIASGEVKPRIRSPKIWKVTPLRTASNFGWSNLGAIFIYLLILIGIGIYFSFRNQSTEDFFRGGQRVPWWAAGCSIFATMLSSLTFMSIPAKSYATNWLYFLINMTIIALAPFIIYYILPFFRRINATSAYQYLELRFNLAVRLFASASYILFQVGRMAIVMYLPALALSTVTPISIDMSILMHGAIEYHLLHAGWIEAVIWTDTVQTFVLLGGALLSFLLVVFSPEIGFDKFFSTALNDAKFQMVDWSWNYTGTALWVVILGGLGQTLIPYSSDQGVVQRYMSVATEKKQPNPSGPMRFFHSLPQYCSLPWELLSTFSTSKIQTHLTQPIRPMRYSRSSLPDSYLSALPGL